MIRDNLLLRYLEEKSFVDMFMSGHIRLNSLGFFWGEHDEPTKDGQIDTMEGIVCPIGAKSIDECSRFDGYRYYNLLCCNRLEYIQTESAIGWYSNEQMYSFGNYVVIIKDPDEFQRRLVNAASEQNYKCLCHSVEYSDKIDTTRDVFDKTKEYAYQNEWRAAVVRGVQVAEPCELFVGALNDIAEWCFTKELQRKLERLFYERDFKNSHNAVYGNVTRDELRKDM